MNSERSTTPQDIGLRSPNSRKHDKRDTTAKVTTAEMTTDSHNRSLWKDSKGEDDQGGPFGVLYLDIAQL